MDRRICSVFGAVMFCGVFGASPVFADTRSEAEQLLASGRSGEAYALLLKDEPSEVGHPEFDYLFGRAALASGEAARATLIFERLLMVAPNHAGARLDMGRAYFALGDHERAKAEFESLLRLDPPPAARQAIEQHLAAIEAHRRTAKTRATAYVEAGFGHDSNVTVGPRQSTLLLPVLGMSFTLSESAQAKSDTYSQVGVGGEVTHHLSDQDALFLAADLRVRDYGKVNPYDQQSGELRGGYVWSSGPSTYRLFASYNDFRLESDPYRRISTLGGDWRYQFDARNQVSVFGQVAAIRYVDRQLSANDNDQYLLGVNWLRQPVGGDRLTTLAALFVGTEQEDKVRTDGNKKFIGLRGGLSYALRPDLDVFAGVSWQYGAYDRENALYFNKRRDNQYDATMGAAWRFAQGWSIRPGVTWTQNDSNVAINEFQRTEANIFLRRDF